MREYEIKDTRETIGSRGGYEETDETMEMNDASWSPAYASAEHIWNDSSRVTVLTEMSTKLVKLYFNVSRRQNKREKKDCIWFDKFWHCPSNFDQLRTVSFKSGATYSRYPELSSKVVNGLRKELAGLGSHVVQHPIQAAAASRIGLKLLLSLF
jgi:hypothetical protein